MFEQSVIPLRRARPWTYTASMSLQLALLGGAMLVPLLRVEALPPVKLGCDCRMPPRGVTVVSAQLERSAAGSSGAAVVLARRTAPKPFLEPGTIPRGVARIEEEAPAVGGGPSTGGTERFGIQGGIGDPSAPSVFRQADPPPLPKPQVTPAPATSPASPKPEPLRIGGKVRPPRLIHEVKPGYPHLAVISRISGTVRIEAILTRDGTVQSLRVVSGHPLLVKAAVDAVRQWRYEPTLLNGVPTEIALAIDVNFTLNR